MFVTKKGKTMGQTRKIEIEFDLTSALARIHAVPILQGLEELQEAMSSGHDWTLYVGISVAAAGFKRLVAGADAEVHAFKQKCQGIKFAHKPRDKNLLTLVMLY